MAAIALDHGNPAEALKELEETAPYELGGDRPPFTAGATLYPVYLRGLAYLNSHNYPKAEEEFNRLLVNKSLVWNFPTGVLARLQLARAYLAEGDFKRARSTYDQYFALWSRSDPGIPILIGARKAYASIRQ